MRQADTTDHVLRTPPTLSDRRFVLGVTLVFALLCSVPYVVADRRTPEGEQFVAVLKNHFDQAYYLAIQRSVADGLPERNRFTAEAGAPGPVAQLYPVMGWLERVTGMSAMLAYHLPRLLAVLSLPALLAWLFALCLPGPPVRWRWATVLALGASGLVSLAPAWDLVSRTGERIPESIPLYSLAVFPHFAVSYAGLTLALVAIAMAVRGRPPVRVAGAALVAGGLLALGHTFLLLPVGMVLAGALCVVLVGRITGRLPGPSPVGRFLAAGLVAVPALPVIVSLQREQRRLEDLNQARFPTAAADAWWTWFAGWGVVAVLAVVGLLWFLRHLRTDPSRPGFLLLLAWFAAQYSLMYLPFTVFQRRYSEGLVIPLAGLAAVGLAAVPWRSMAGKLLVVGVGFTLVAGAANIVDALGASGLRIPDAQARLLAGVEVDDVVLAGHELSYSLPVFTPGRVHAGRPVETVRYRDKRQGARRWAAAPSTEASRRWLREAGVTVVAVDRKDDSLDVRLPADPAAACLAAVFDEGRFAAFQVDRTCLAAGAGRPPA